MPELVVLSLDDCRYALNLAAVEKVVRIVEVTPLPDAPDIIVGVINVQGRIIPVVDIRKRFLLPKRETNVNDQLILAHTNTRVVALIADAVLGVVECSDKEVPAAETILPGMAYVKGVARLKDGVVLIHDLGRFLSLDEAQVLDNVMVSA